MVRSSSSAAARARLADVLDRCRSQVVDEWMARVKARVARTGVPLTDLQNALPQYLVALAEALRSGEVTIERAGEEAWYTIAREHGLTRVHLGFDVDQLVHEFIELRRVLEELVGREHALSDENYAALAELIEAGIAVSVRSYVEARDHEARRSQAENIGFVTHELRNPLATACLVAPQIRRLATPRQISLLDQLDRSLRRLDELIESVLQAQKLEAGVVGYHPDRIELEDVLRDVVLAAESAAADKGLSFNARFDPELVLEVDPVLTRSAVENLVDNALKYTDDGRVDLEVDDLGSDVVVHVRDTGPGVSPAEARTIFDPFVRKNTRKPGTGLGLAITRRAIELQGGVIEVEATEGKGCHFWFRLPKRVRRLSDARPLH